MTVVSRRNELHVPCEVIGIIQDEQPALVRAKPTLNGLHGERLVLGARSLTVLREPRSSRSQKQAPPESAAVAKKCVDVLIQVPVGIFHGRLGLANPTKTA